jgi:hypothetical protein
MKKLILPIAILAIALASCKKETSAPAEQTGGMNIKEQVADIIGKADHELYDRIYNSDPNSRAPKPSIKVTHGIFHIPPPPYGAADGTCLPCGSCVCHITITWPAFVTDSTEVTEITENYYASFSEVDEAEIVLNDTIPYKVDSIKSVNVKFDNTGASQLTCTLYEP